MIVGSLLNVNTENVISTEEASESEEETLREKLVFSWTLLELLR